MMEFLAAADMRKFLPKQAETHGYEEHGEEQGRQKGRGKEECWQKEGRQRERGQEYRRFNQVWPLYTLISFVVLNHGL